MPSKNTIKIYTEGGFYHIYNRGVEKRIIFNKDIDYKVFLKLLKTYLSPATDPFVHPFSHVQGFQNMRLRPLKSFYGQVELLSFCLMPNHFHLLIKQNVRNGMQTFMQALCTTYSNYFNRKYKRVGILFQGRYKAVLVETESYLLHLSRYIHLNPYEAGLTRPGLVTLVTETYSSYAYYLGSKNAIWIKPDEILSYFKTAQNTSLNDCLSYQSFVEDYKKDSAEVLGDLVIEKE